MLSATLHAVLRCPQHPDGDDLLTQPGAVQCPDCGAEYPVVDGIPDMTAGRHPAGSFTAAEARQWDAQAAAYDAGRERDLGYMAGVKAVVARLGVEPGDRVLDAGCGTGLTVRRYHRPGVRAVALDLSLDSLRHLRRQLPAAAAVDLVCGDLAALPFAGGAFDKVLCANTLQHLPDPDVRGRAVGELARVARPGARVVVSAHNYSRPKRRAGWAKEGSAGGHSGPVRYIYRFDPAEFESLLATSLRVRRVVGAGLPLAYRYKLTPLMRGVEWLAGRTRLSTRWGNMLVGVGTPA